MEVLRVATLLIAALLAPFAASDDPADAILGRWFTEEKEAQINIVERPNSDGEPRYFGTIVWLRQPLYDGPGEEYGDPLRDASNPDPERRHDPILGLEILKDFHYNERKNRWQGGTVYDPYTGKTYRGHIKLQKAPSAVGGHQLDLRGYWLIPLFGRTTTWTRVPPDFDPPPPEPLSPRPDD